MTSKFLLRSFMLLGCTVLCFYLLKLTVWKPEVISENSTYVFVLKEKLVVAQKKIASLEKITKGSSPMAEKLMEAQERIEALETILSRHDLLYEIEKTLPATRKLERDLDLEKARKTMEDKLTLVVFSADESSLCLNSRLDTIMENYPRTKLIVIHSGETNSDLASAHSVEYVPNVRKEGEALVLLSSKVKTDYFLFLSSGASIYPYKADQSVSWLFHALETLQEVDFVGGSNLKHEEEIKYPVIDVPCYRLRMCNWTFSQTMEYRYSVGDMMVCEETSSSFMGRTKSIAKVGQFDPVLDVMATTDFFLRAKGKAVVGLRPEVFFTFSRACATRVDKELKVAFMNKHQVYRLKDALGQIINGVDLTHFKSIIDNDKHWVETNTYAKTHYNDGLWLNLQIGADYLESKNISYYLDGGVSLGAIKVRGLLPWDSGDIDLGFLANWQDVVKGLEEYTNKRGIKAKVTTSPMAGDKKEVMLFVGDYAVNTMFPQDQDKANQDLYMYVYVHGRRYPVLKTLFQSLRGYYGISYLEHHGFHGTARMKCTLPGHHACVPDEFALGAGHWREYYCQI